MQCPSKKEVTNGGSIGITYHYVDILSPKGVSGDLQDMETSAHVTGADLGGGCRGCAPPPPPPPPEMTCGFLIQLVFCKNKKKTTWFIGVEEEQETSAPPPKKILDPPLREDCANTLPAFSIEKTDAQFNFSVFGFVERSFEVLFQTQLSKNFTLPKERINVNVT